MVKVRGRRRHLIRAEHPWLFIPPLGVAGTYLDEVLVVMFVALLGTLLLSEALRALAGGLRREMLIAFFFCLGITTIMLLVVKVVSMLG
jgi:hypothetical protein